MKTKRYSFILEAMQPIAHHSGTLGNVSLFMRRKVHDGKGNFEDVPFVTGDTMRHGMRDASAIAYLDAAGLLDEKALGEAATRLLFSGGMMTGKGDASKVDLARFTEMCTLCPPLGLLGGCVDNRSVPGRLFVDEATLICSETERFIPDHAKEWLTAERVTIKSFREHMDEVTRVRMDPLLDPSKRGLLLPEAHVDVMRRLGAGERAHAADDAVEKSDSKSTMMPRNFETLAQGSLFFWQATCNCLDALEEDSFDVMVAAFLANCVVGGKKGTSHGRMRSIRAWNVDVRRPSDTVSDCVALGKTTGSLFVEHVAKHKEQIREWLRIVNA